MSRLDETFRWMTEVAAPFRLEEDEPYKACLDEGIGQLVQAFGQEFTESFLMLTDEEIFELYGRSDCPLSKPERNELRQSLIVHVLSCKECIDSELREEARNAVADTFMRKKLQGKHPPLSQSAAKN